MNFMMNGNGATHRPNRRERRKAEALARKAPPAVCHAAPVGIPAPAQNGDLGGHNPLFDDELAYDETEASGGVVGQDDSGDLLTAKRAVALAPADEKLNAFQAEAIRLGRCDHLNPGDIAAVLSDIATNHESLRSLGVSTIEHIIREALVGREAIANTAPVLDDDYLLPMPSGGVGATPNARELIVRCASDIVPEKIEWLWHGRVAIGKTTLIAGEPGLGKSQLMCALAATVTNGERWPCNEGAAPLGSVLILSAEDDAADTVVPRLMAAGADVGRVHIISSVRCAVATDQSPSRRSFNLQADLDLLERTIGRIGNVRLVVIDPISSYMGKTDSHKNADVRATLEPLGELASRLRVAVVAITHFSKGGGKSAVDSFIGSIGFVASARAAFTVMRDPDDHDRRLFLTAKNNLAKDGSGLAFRLEQRLVKGDILASSIAWEGEHVTKTADEILAERDAAADSPSRVEAEDFLRDVLSGGPRPSKEIEREAKEAGVAWRTVRRAQKSLGVRAERRAESGDGLGKSGRWYWCLPDGSEPPKAASFSYDGHVSNVDALGESGHLRSTGGDR